MKFFPALLVVLLFSTVLAVPVDGKSENSASQIIRLAQARVTANDFDAAIALLCRAMDKAKDRSRLERCLYDIQKKYYLTAVKPVNALYYFVKPGDTLTKIAGRHRITVNLLKRLNRKTGSNLKVNEKLRVVSGPFDVRVLKKSYTLQVMKKGKVLFTYPVGLGKSDSTPVGKFTAGAKLVKPVQFDRERGRKIKFGEPDHTLGTRWITFSGPYGIHGTVDPGSIGKQRSKGCVRMLNKHVEEVFDLVVSRKTAITIVDAP